MTILWYTFLQFYFLTPQKWMYEFYCFILLQTSTGHSKTDKWASSDLLYLWTGMFARVTCYSTGLAYDFEINCLSVLPKTPLADVCFFVTSTFSSTFLFCPISVLQFFFKIWSNLSSQYTCFPMLNVTITHKHTSLEIMILS